MDGNLPFSVEEFQNVFKPLAELAGTLGSPFEQRDGADSATIVDLTHVLDMLAAHFYESDKTLENDLSDDIKS